VVEPWRGVGIDLKTLIGGADAAATAAERVAGAIESSAYRRGTHSADQSLLLAVAKSWAAFAVELRLIASGTASIEATDFQGNRIEVAS
jgi:hypothetical protein